MMRAAIRQKLINDIPDIQGRCYEPQAASKDTQKPYLVLLQGVDAEDSLWTGFRRIIEVWPYVARTTFQKVDDLANKVIASLDKQLITDTVTGEVFSCQYLGTVGQDYVDEDWDAITRGLRFAVLALQPVSTEETVADDSWIEALATWTSNILCQDWTVYKNVWPLGYERPATMWRIAGIETNIIGQGLYEIRKRIIGHVLGRTANEEILSVQTIIQELSNAIKIPLDVNTRKYMTVNQASVDYRANAITAGQITLTLSRYTDVLTEEAIKIGEVLINQEVKQ
ncbi:hypothetical protein Q2T46_11730 [Thermoanaerobacterium sp. CMT5567-10]|uniref:hypothetical protein n=1 Tax=Thermoanaerobacterium sp. CMT5567-10 TaxID=3061989 RepID=UPI0026DFB165|nr:hypothetical protein [Thermoanaerobacterium sp. CMT5567-10]WKV08197.1 hypothetical protein Q2T46_11730 [Thermoanaerobacterium sp. CMT5567-10]